MYLSGGKKKKREKRGKGREERGREGRGETACKNHMHRRPKIRVFISLILAISQPSQIYFNKAMYTEDRSISEGIFNKWATHSNSQNKH